MRGIRLPARNPVPRYTRVWVSMSVLNPVLCPIIQLFAQKTEQCGFIMQNTVKLLRTDQYNSDSEVDPSKIRLRDPRNAL